MGKETAFLVAVVAALGLTGVTVLAARAEALGQNRAHRAAYDVATPRPLSARLQLHLGRGVRPLGFPGGRVRHYPALSDAVAGLATRRAGAGHRPRLPAADCSTPANPGVPGCPSRPARPGSTTPGRLL